MNFLEQILRSFKRKSKTKGAFGAPPYLGRYTTLKVIPKSKRTPENSNSYGVEKEK